jgi:hypothetical protein
MRMIVDPGEAVVLSAAKDLIAACNRHEILRCAQDDRVRRGAVVDRG